jgi:hypothetical protein
MPYNTNLHPQKTEPSLPWQLPYFSSAPALLHACASHSCTRRESLPLTLRRSVRSWVSVASSTAFLSTHSTALWCESALPGRAAHPAGTLSQCHTARESGDDFNINSSTSSSDITGWVQGICLHSSFEAFPLSRATNAPTSCRVPARPHTSISVFPPSRLPHRCIAHNLPCSFVTPASRTPLFTISTTWLAAPFPVFSVSTLCPSFGVWSWGPALFVCQLHCRRRRSDYSNT